MHRGRKSAEELSVVVHAERQFRPPDVPSELTAAEAVEWRSITQSLPFNWFGRESHGLLTALCRHIVHARRIAGMFTTALAKEPIDIADCQKLSRMSARESRAFRQN